MQTNTEFPDSQYIKWLTELKTKIRNSQIKAAIAANSVLIKFYWELGKMISEKENIWGNKLIEQVAKDLQAEFQEMKGLSRSNLFYCKKFYKFYSSAIVQQAVGLLEQPLYMQIPWGHNILIFTKSKDIYEAEFYIDKTLCNNWSRDTLALQIKSDLYKREGKAITNFSTTMPLPDSDLAQQTLRDPYVFDFITITESAKEKDIEQQLVTHITKFLLELGKGFAFVGQQYHLEIGEKDYYIDLLFYHIHLKCYVVIELKNTSFIPEYAGKLNFYLSAVDTLLKRHDDKSTIGILLCREKNNIEAEFSLRNINKPMGVSEFQIIESLPDELKDSLPSIEDIETEFMKLGL